MARISGRVITSRSKRPVKGAHVYPLLPGVHPIFEVQTTDEDGAFVLSDLPSGTHRLQAQASVAVPEYRYNFVFSGTSEEFDTSAGDHDILVEIQSAGSIIGAVMENQAGSKVRGAVVRLLEPTTGQFQAAAADGGTFALSNVSVGGNTLGCEATGFKRWVQKIFVPDALEAGALKLPIFLEPLPKEILPNRGIVKGFVLNEVGNPAVGANVSLVGQNTNVSSVVVKNYFDYESGNFEFRDVPEGRYRIIAVKPGMSPFEMELGVIPGRDNWTPDIRLSSLPYVTPPEIEYFRIEPRVLTEGDSVTLTLKTKSESRMVTASGTIIGPAGWNIGFSIDGRNPDGSIFRKFENWNYPGLFVVVQVFVTDADTGKTVTIPLNVQFEVVRKEAPPLHPESKIFTTS